MTARLGDIAYCRAGDKGDDSILAVAAYDASDFPRLISALAPAAVAQHFGVPPAHVTVVAMPQLAAASVVVRGRLRGGVTRSASIDPHGKTLSFHLLDMELP